MIPGTWRSRTCDGRNEMHPSVTLAASRWAWPPQPIRNTHSSIDNATVGRGLSNRRRRDAHADGESQRSECVTMGQGNGSVGRRTGPDQCRPEPRTQGGDSDRRWDKCRQPDLGPRAFAVQVCPGIQFVVARTFKGTIRPLETEKLPHPTTSSFWVPLTVTAQTLLASTPPTPLKCSCVWAPPYCQSRVAQSADAGAIRLASPTRKQSQRY